MDMSAEAIKRLMEAGADLATVRTVYEDSSEKVLLVNTGKPDQPREMVTILNKDPRQCHEFTTVRELLRFMAGRECSDRTMGAVFVGKDRIEAVGEYGAISPDTATVKLVLSEEMDALIQCISGILQRNLWRLLITDLADAFPDSLRLAISSLSSCASSGSSATIDQTGMVSGDSRNAVTVGWLDAKSEKHQTIPVDWVWSGRLWHAHDAVTQIPIRLEIEAREKGITFILHPRGLKTIMRDARTALVDHIRDQVESMGIAERFTVYEGTY